MTLLRISELAQRAKVPVSTVRYYERIGLLGPPQRAHNGYRTYDESAAEHLAFIGRAKLMRMPLDQVSELIELWSSGGCRPVQARIRSYLAARIALVRAQRRDLTTFERQLRRLSSRLGRADAPAGPCELDCDCVHLDPADAGGVCSRFPTIARYGGGVCSLGVEEMPGRIAEWRDVLDGGEVVERGEHAVRVAFPLSADTAGRLARLCAAEVGCCSFLFFSVEVSADEIVLVVEAPDDAEATRIVHQLFGTGPDAPGSMAEAAAR